MVKWVTTRWEVAILILLLALPYAFAQNQTPPNPPFSAWTDPVTGLLWTKEDYDVLIDWQQASDYCANMRLGGRSGWRLPEYDELADLHRNDATGNVNYFGQVSAIYVDAAVKLKHRYIWSATKGYVWDFAGDSASQRAVNQHSTAGSAWTLCVWESEEHKKRRLEEAAAPTWTDPKTGMTWTRKDNGADLTWSEAVNYCQNLQLNGSSGWRLPFIGELADIYDPSERVAFRNGQQTYTNSFRGGIDPSGSEWWSATENGYPWAWAFDTGFGHGSRQCCVAREARIGRALCVLGQ